MSALRKLLLPALPNENLRWVQAEDLWHEARILIGELAERAQAQHRLHNERLANALTESGATLLATQQVTALTGAIARQLPRLAIPSAWMALYDDATAVTADAPVRLVLKYDARADAGKGRGPWRRARDRRPMPGVDLLSSLFATLARRASIVVEPLFFHERPLGCLLLEMGPREGMVYESLAEQVSSALEGARLVDPARRGGDPPPGRRARAPRKGDGDRRPHPDLDPAAGRDGPRPGDRRRACTPRPRSAATTTTSCPWTTAAGLGSATSPATACGPGLVMLMMQSGIGALARKMPDAAPRELLLALNTMLVENVRVRLGQHEHATLTLIRYRRDGSLTFAGAHEEILIRRAATGRCERIETPGAWVGAKRDIAAGTVDSTARLESGDLLVLYTDGLTEAAAADGSGARFGIDRLIALVEEHGASTPATGARRDPRRCRRVLARAATTTSRCSSRATPDRNDLLLDSLQQLDVEDQRRARRNVALATFTVSRVRRAGQRRLLADLHLADPLRPALDDAVERERRRLPVRLARRIEHGSIEQLARVVHLHLVRRLRRLAGSAPAW